MRLRPLVSCPLREDSRNRDNVFATRGNVVAGHDVIFGPTGPRQKELRKSASAIFTAEIVAVRQRRTHSCADDARLGCLVSGAAALNSTRQFAHAIVLFAICDSGRDS